MIECRSEIAATVWKVRAKVDDQVGTDTELVVLESMKMEIPVTSPSPGTVVEIRVNEGDRVAAGDVIAVIEAS